MIRVMVTRAGEEPRLHTFEGEAIEVGSAASCDLTLPAIGVSRRHFRLERRGPGVVIRDLGASNGTYVNRERLTGTRALVTSDRIDIPEYALTVVMDGAPATPARPRATPARVSAPVMSAMSTAADPVGSVAPAAPAVAAEEAGEAAANWPTEGAPLGAVGSIQARAQAWHERPDRGHLLRGELLAEALAWRGAGAVDPPVGAREEALITASVAAEARRRRGRWRVGLALVGSLLAGVGTSRGLLAGGTAAYAQSLGALAAERVVRGRAELRVQLCLGGATRTAALIREQPADAADAALRRASEALACADDLDGEAPIEALKDATRALLRGAYGPVIARESAPITALAVDPSGCHVAWGRTDGALRRWNRCEPDTPPKRQSGAGAVRSLILGQSEGFAFDRAGHLLRWTEGEDTEPVAIDLEAAPTSARALALSDDGRLLALASDEAPTILLYELGEGDGAVSAQVIGDLAAPAAALAFAPGGGSLIAAIDREVLHWPLRRGRAGKGKRLEAHESPITALQTVACAPRQGAAESWLLSGDDAGAVHARPLGSKRKGPAPLLGLGQAVELLGLTRECQHVLGAAGRSLFVWDLGARDPTATPRELRHERPITAIALGDGDEQVITAAAGEVSVWDLSRPAEAPRHLRHGRSLVAMDVIRGADALIAGFEDGSIRRWDLAASTSGAAASLALHPTTVRAAALDREGARMISAAGARATLWKIDARGRPERSQSLDSQGGAIAAVAISDDGLWAATADDDGQLLVWSLAGRAPSAHPYTIARGVRRLLFVERHLVAAGSRGACVVGLGDLDLRRCQELPHTGEVSHVAALPGGAKIVLGGSASALSLIDLDAHARGGGIATTTLPKGQGLVTALAVSGDGSWLAEASESGDLRLWRLARGAAVEPEGTRLAAAIGQIYALAIDPGGAWLAVAGEDRTIRLYRPGAGHNPEAILEHGASAATALTFAGGTLLSGAADGVIRAWSVTTPTGPAIEIGRQSGVIRQLLVGEAAGQVIAASDDPAIHVWPLSARSLADLAEAIAGPPP